MNENNLKYYNKIERRNTAKHLYIMCIYGIISVKE